MKKIFFVSLAVVAFIAALILSAEEHFEYDAYEIGGTKECYVYFEAVNVAESSFVYQYQPSLLGVDEWEGYSIRSLTEGRVQCFLSYDIEEMNVEEVKEKFEQGVFVFSMNQVHSQSSHRPTIGRPDG